MKNRIFLPALSTLLLAGLWFTQSAFQDPAPEAADKSIKWNETTHNFGDIPMGPDATATFTFKNKSKKAVVVKNAEAGCSCTIPTFTADPIKKNKKGSVTASYKTQGRPGFFKKFVKVTFEDGRTAELVITGNVVDPPKM
jgi:hypothetical protein